MSTKDSHQPIESLDLLREVKEMQLQHGLRADDFARYHKYITNRLHTLRSQLKLSNGKQKFLNKKVTASIANDARHIVLLALEAERCWASAEEYREKIAEATAGEEAKKGPSVVSMLHQQRNRLNKAVKRAKALVEVVEAVGTEALKGAARGYCAEMEGRCHISHADHQGAKDAFHDARTHYYQLHKHCTQEQWSVVVAKVRECDDRVIYSMQRLGEDALSYNPPFEAEKDAGTDAARVTWLGRPLTVYSVKMKELLRTANEAEAQRTEFHASRDCVSGTTNAQNKLLDFFDRGIGIYNDAVSHNQQDVKDSVGDRTQLQLLEHYLRYQLNELTLGRQLFLVEVYSRRFEMTTAAVEKGGPLPPLSTGSTNSGTSSGNFDFSLAASPHEIVHLYDQAIECLNKMSILPGVEDDDALADFVNDQTALCRAGRLLYSGQGWAIAGSRPKAFGCFKQCEKILNEVSSTESKKQAQQFLLATRRATIRLAAIPHLTSSPSTTEVAAASTTPSNSFAGPANEKREPVLIDAPKGEFKAYKTFVRLPPDFQSVPCKPVFVDIASTFIDLPSQAGAPAQGTAPKAKERAKEGHPGEEEGESGKKAGWFSGWGWGGKKK